MELNSALEKMQKVQSFPNLRCYPTICLEGTSKTKNNFSLVSLVAVLAML
jgi:hypothetical protein